MDWKVASVIVLVLWGTYGIFGSKATEVHGEKVTVVFETVAFILLALVAAGSAMGDFQKVTTRSFINASVMGLMSAGGFYFFLYAMRLSPQNLGVITMTTGLYPVITVLVMHFLGQHLAPQQWLGVALATAGLALVNWK